MEGFSGNGKAIFSTDAGSIAGRRRIHDVSGRFRLGNEDDSLLHMSRRDL